MFQSFSGDLKTEYGRDCYFESSKNLDPPSLTMIVKYKTITEIIFRILIEYDSEFITIRSQSLTEEGQVAIQIDPIELSPENRDKFETDKIIDNFISLYESDIT